MSRGERTTTEEMIVVARISVRVKLDMRQDRMTVRTWWTGWSFWTKRGRKLSQCAHFTYLGASPLSHGSYSRAKRSRSDIGGWFQSHKTAKRLG